MRLLLPLTALTILIRSLCVPLNAKETCIPYQFVALYLQTVASETVPGINAALTDSAGVVWAQGFSFADLENQIAMRPEHERHIGSVAAVS